MYQILIKSQILRQFNDINNIKMGKRMPLKINQEFKKRVFIEMFGQRYLT